MNESSMTCLSNSIPKSTSSSDVDELVQAFNLAVQTAVVRSQEAVNMAIAAGDEETVVQERIRLSTLEMTWELFTRCQTEIAFSHENFLFDLYAV
jgi:hypothetical protein